MRSPSGPPCASRWNQLCQYEAAVAQARLQHEREAGPEKRLPWEAPLPIFGVTVRRTGS